MNLASTLTIIITAIFLLIIFSYYYLLLFKRQKKAKEKKFNGISIIVPAHNEEKYIAETLQSILEADFPGKKEIIVVDDGSNDKTYSIAKKFPVRIIRGEHKGKSRSINKALKVARYELVAVVDADSCIQKDSLVEALKFLGDDKVAAVCATVKVKNRKTFIGMWLHIEQLYNSLLRNLFSKVNVNIVAPGPLSIYKKKCLQKIGGFEYKGYSEDVDVAVRLIKAGYNIVSAEKSISETNMPVTLKGFARQRKRFARGWINIFKRHLKLNHTFMQIYTLPLMFFGYLQAIIMGVITSYNLVSGYLNYFVARGAGLSLGALGFFFDWFSIIGIIKWFIRIIMHASPITAFDIIGLSSSLLVYPLYFLAIIKYDKKITWQHIIPVFFLFPFWLVIMIFYIINAGEVFNKHQTNIWEK
ncbi:glycosyltransferase family 2 protein [Candidatus Woesearchaeota archaeon]|nr:glycosyltransferase family 2 protein [Candidatus Woesearchaeota archaeon]